MMNKNKKKNKSAPTLFAGKISGHENYGYFISAKMNLKYV